MEHASDFLNVVPSRALGTTFRSTEFQVVLKMRLGLRIFNTRDCVKCRLPMDPYGVHALSCGHGPERTQRHNDMRDFVFTACQAAGFHTTREFPPGLVPGSLERPGDVLVRNWQQGRFGAMDVTITSTLQDNTIFQAANEVGFCASKAEARKEAKYEGILEQVDIIPLAFETFGGMTAGTRRTLKRLADRTYTRQSISFGQACAYIFQMASVTLQRGNAAMLLGRMDFDENLGLLAGLL